MRTIVHLSADVPDSMDGHKTRAVENLIATAPEYRHIIYSLNRVPGLKGLDCLPSGEDRLAIAYRAPDKSLMITQRMRTVADFIVADLRRRSVSPDMVHAHKLTVEGLAGLEIARVLGARLAVSVRGDTDVKLLRARPDLRSRFRRIAEAADILMSMSQWPIPEMTRALGPTFERCCIVPSITRADRLMAAPVVGEPRLVSAFHLNVWRRKGARVLAEAAALAAADVPELTIDIIGGGAPAAVMALRRVIRAASAERHVRLLGPMPHAEVQGRLARYAGFVLPTVRETYGMVYAEALFAGLPVAFSRGRGIDGMTPAERTGPRIDPDDPRSVSAAMVSLVRDEQAWKAKIAEAQRRGEFGHLRADAIGAAYRAVLAKAFSESPIAARRFSDDG